MNEQHDKPPGPGGIGHPTDAVPANQPHPSEALSQYPGEFEGPRGDSAACPAGGQYDPISNMGYGEWRVYIPVETEEDSDKFEWEKCDIMLRRLDQDEESSSSSSSPSKESSSESSSESSPPSSSESLPESSSAKDSAIVPDPNSPTGYSAWFVVEEPEVRFNDTMVLKAIGLLRNRRSIEIPFDHRIVPMIEDGTLRVKSWSADTPCPLGFRISGRNVIISRPTWFIARILGGIPNEIVVGLTAVRRGFKGMRLPTRTAAQFEANEKRLHLDA